MICPMCHEKIKNNGNKKFRITNSPRGHLKKKELIHKKCPISFPKGWIT